MGGRAQVLILILILSLMPKSMRCQILILIIIHSLGRAGPGATPRQVLQLPWLLIRLQARDHPQSTPSPSQRLL